MTTVNVRVPLLRDDNPIGFISFGYNNESGISALLPDRPEEVDVFFLEQLILQIDAGEIAEIDDFVNGFIGLNLSRELNNAALAYFPLPQNIGVTRRVDEEFVNIWTIPATENTAFVTDGSDWGIGPSGSNSIADALVTGSLGEMEFVNIWTLEDFISGEVSVIGDINSSGEFEIRSENGGIIDVINSLGEDVLVINSAREFEIVSDGASVIDSIASSFNTRSLRLPYFV